MSSWHAYPSVFNLGHKAIADLLARNVIVEEKIDGSQFSFGWFPEEDATTGMGLKCKSKGAIIHVDAPPAMFKSAVETVKRLHAEGLLHENWTYRGEVLAKPKHNALAYDHAPTGNIILFDVNTDEEAYLAPLDLSVEAVRLGLQSVPVLMIGKLDNVEACRALLDRESILGGQKIEGIVIKPLNRDYFGLDKKLLMGKFVSEAFREVHGREWKLGNPTRTDVLAVLINKVGTAARWQKAVMHLQERGEYEDSVKIIGKLIKEVQADLVKEEQDFIKDQLWHAFKDQVIRGSTRGLPEWWKTQLLTLQFEREALHEVQDVPSESLL